MPALTDDQRQWLRQQRTAARIGQAQLARMVGTSQVRVSEWELGRHSPTDAQWEKVQEVLGQPRVDYPRLESLTWFDPLDEPDWPARPGIYILYDQSSRAVYVGHSNDVSTRFQLHREHWFKPPIVVSAAFVFVPDAQQRLDFERVLIGLLHHQLLFNKQHA